MPSCAAAAPPPPPLWSGSSEFYLRSGSFFPLKFLLECTSQPGALEFSLWHDMVLIRTSVQMRSSFLLVLLCLRELTFFIWTTRFSRIELLAVFPYPFTVWQICSVSFHSWLSALSISTQLLTSLSPLLGFLWLSTLLFCLPLPRVQLTCFVKGNSGFKPVFSAVFKEAGLMFTPFWFTNFHHQAELLMFKRFSFHGHKIGSLVSSPIVYAF